MRVSNAHRCTCDQFSGSTECQTTPYRYLNAHHQYIYILYGKISKSTELQTTLYRYQIDNVYLTDTCIKVIYYNYTNILSICHVLLNTFMFLKLFQHHKITINILLYYYSSVQHTENIAQTYRKKIHNSKYKCKRRHIIITLQNAHSQCTHLYQSFQQ